MSIIPFLFSLTIQYKIFSLRQSYFVYRKVLFCVKNQTVHSENKIATHRMAILFSLLWYSYPPEMSARIIDTIIIGIISNIPRLLFKAGFAFPIATVIHSGRNMEQSFSPSPKTTIRSSDTLYLFIISKMPLSLWTGSTSIVPFVSHTWGSVCRGISFTSLWRRR